MLKVRKLRAIATKIRLICFIVPKELVFINIPLRDDGTD